MSTVKYRFRPGDKVKRIENAPMGSTIKKYGIYTVHSCVATGNILLKEDLNFGTFESLNFELVSKSSNKKYIPKFKKHFVKVDKKNKVVQVYDLTTKKLLHEADEIGLFRVSKIKLGRMTGYSGYVQEIITESFIERYKNILGVRYVNYEPNHLDNHCVIKLDGYINTDIYPSDDITGIKGLEEDIANEI